jgi:hypothetical protein
LSSLSRTFRYCPASPGHSGIVQPLQDSQVLPSLSRTFRLLPSISRTFRYCPASPGHYSTSQPIHDIQVLPSLSRTFRYCPASPRHSGYAHSLQDIQVVSSLFRTFMYCSASPGHSDTESVHTLSRTFMIFSGVFKLSCTESPSLLKNLSYGQLFKTYCDIFTHSETFSTFHVFTFLVSSGSS